MRSKYILIVASVLMATAAAAWVVYAGNPDIPPGPPETTSSYTLEAIYNRLDTGEAGTQSTFTEPISGPMVGTGHTLDEIMSVAPSVDDTQGATQMQVLTGRTAWGLTSAGWGLMTGTYPLAPVPKTGQTKCYTASIGSEEDCPEDTGTYPGQDGDWQKGVTWPNPRFTDNSDGTVTDNLTGLVWLMDANCANTMSHDPDFTGDGKMTWMHALVFVAGFNATAYDACGAGQTDWRLPNVREMHSLIDLSQYDPALPTNPFTGVQSSYYWSSTTNAENTNEAWFVRLNDGYVNYGSKDGNTFYVWPVRGGQ